MKILFITATRLGDGVLSMGALDYLISRYPDAQVTVACGPVIEGLFPPIPNVRQVISLRKEKYAGHWIKLAKKTMGQKWDVVVDLRNSALSRLLRANKKYIYRNSDDRMHKVLQIARVLQAEGNPPAPRLWFDAATLAQAQRLVPDGVPVLGVGPASNWKGKTWPAENFIELIERLTADHGVMPHARVAVFAAPGEEDVASQVLNAFPADRRVDVIAKAAPLAVAAALKRCALYIGNDSGLMHCAAAVGTPTVGLFGPSWPQVYGPWGSHCSYVTTPETFAEIQARPGYDKNQLESLMTTLPVETVERAVVRLVQRLKEQNP